MFRTPRLPGFLHLQSTRTRLIVWNAAFLALLLIVLSLVLDFSVRAMLLGSVDHELRVRAHRVLDNPPSNNQSNLRPAPSPNGAEPSDDDLPPPGAESDSLRENRAAQFFRPRLMNARGQVIMPPGINAPWDAHALAHALEGREVFSTILVAGEPVRIISRPFSRRGALQGVVQAPYPLNDVQRAIAGINLVLLLFLPVSLACAVWGGTLLTNRTLSSVRRITQAAQGIGAQGRGAQGLSERLPVTGQDEFAALSETFNGMLARLEKAFQEQATLVERLQDMVEQQRRFTADASHELRTPLTAIKANTSLCLSSRPSVEEYRQSIEEIDQSAAAMAHLVHDLLLLARSDAGQPARDRKPLPVQNVVERAIAGIPRRDDTAPITTEIADAELQIYGSEIEIVRLLTNLLHNASRHTPASGCITVSAVRDGPRARITVHDTGIGIAPEHLPHLGERFYRVDPARSRPEGGTGLGLSICQSIVNAHDGTLSIQSTPNIGTTVVVTLPLPINAMGGANARA